eukprot:9240693-Pyramimonas_sp.AAC.1
MSGPAPALARPPPLPPRHPPLPRRTHHPIGPPPPPPLPPPLPPPHRHHYPPLRLPPPSPMGPRVQRRVRRRRRLGASEIDRHQVLPLIGDLVCRVVVAYGLAFPFGGSGF